MSEAGKDPAAEAGAIRDANAVRQRWIYAAGFVTWLAAILAPAISFDVALGMNTDAGAQYQAFLLILSAALFLLGWRAIRRLRLWMLAILVVLAAALFLTYSLTKAAWTCAYFPARFDNLHFVMGSEVLPSAANTLRLDPPADTSCQTLMEPWGGDAMQIWESGGVVRRFLILFGLYASAWLALALLVLGAARFSLDSIARR